MAVKPKTIDELGDLQRMVMDIIWENGKVTVKDVVEIISARRKAPPAYTTILTVMQKLEKAGFIRHIRQRNETEGQEPVIIETDQNVAKKRAYRYEPVRSRKYEQSRALRAFMERVWTDEELIGTETGGDTLETISRLTTTRAKVLLFKHLLDDEDLAQTHLQEISNKLNSRIGK